ncbi:MAG TPA: hypothetical protein ENG40_00505 [Thermoprotei archaeon]|nr:hypothetical protein [Thermoprotei archaeon]
MRGLIKSVKTHEYANVKIIECKFNKRGKLIIELPEKILKEIEWIPSENQIVEIRLSKSRPKLEKWDIVMSGKIYYLEGKKVYLSFGGFQALYEAPRERELTVGQKMYIALKKIS